jgi:mannose-1-phosphate guanylyltransferase/mannose-1-phosphate guanylyltransferase/mannose-6-phosphate isomerase
LWPLSRKQRPKQMLALLGERSMLRMTAERVSDEVLFNAPVVVAAESQGGDIRAEFEADGCRLPRLILEPSARNTAPAIALAALVCTRDTVLLVMPSDHLIADPGAFTNAVAAALPAAREGQLVTFGIRPTHPETGFGYIKRGQELSPGLFQVERFVEKPDAATAAAYLVEGSYSWNAGIFLFTAGAYLEALAAHAPDIHDAVREAAPQPNGQEPLVPDRDAFAAVRSQSIDHAVMEHADNVVVVPIDAGWSDVGSWQSLHEASGKDSQGNVLSGSVEMLGCSNCLVRSDGPLVVAIGLEDLAVVATADAVLVVRKSDSQRVSEAVKLLAARSDPRL